LSFNPVKLIVDNLNIYIHAPLIEECRRGSSKAQFRLYDLYSKAMYNLAFRILNNREDSEDILQESFIDCFRNIDSFRFESTFGAWLKKITVNKCINHIKKKKVDLTFPDTLPVNAYEEEEYNEEEIRYETNKIFKGIEMLPEGYRIILTLYLLEGYDHSEISEILGISESTSKSQYSRAKEKLRNILQKS
jgi:RNA polymerase sigma-70 factor (ECF subfamily)